MPSINEILDDLLRDDETPTDDEITAQCGCCHSYVLADDIHELTGQIRNYRIETLDVCDNCADDLERCAACNNHVNGNNRTYSDIHGCYYCDDCYGELFGVCYECNGHFHTDNLTYYCGDRYCDGCYPPSQSDNDDDDQSSGLIHNYSYKPRTVFFGDKSTEYFGIELEVDRGRRVHDAARGIVAALGDIVYLKEDGSLSDDDAGFEIVTHPMTYDYFTANIVPTLPTVFNELRRGGFRSHDTETCGLHVHVSRLAFGDDRNTQEHNVARFLWLFEKFYDEVLRLSRRTSERMERWAARYGLIDGERTEDIFRKATHHNAGRYHIVNLENQHTVEVRCFRGTLKPETFIASVQLVRLFVKLATMGIDVYRLTWGGVTRRALALGYTELDGYITERFRNYTEHTDIAYVGTADGDY